MKCSYETKINDLQQLFAGSNGDDVNYADGITDDVTNANRPLHVNTIDYEIGIEMTQKCFGQMDKF